MPEHESLVPGLNGVEFVALAGRLLGLSRADSLARAHLVLNFVGLSDERYRRVDSFSTGMKQKVKLAQAMVHHPRLLLLDEPTAGLDPAAREEMLSLLRDVAGLGMHILLCTHILPDVERVCDHVAILHQGRLLKSGALRDVLRDDDPAFHVRIKGDEAAFLSALAQEGARAERLPDGSWRIRETGGSPAFLFRAAARSGIQIREFGPRRTRLDEIFERAIGDL